MPLPERTARVDRARASCALLNARLLKRFIRAEHVTQPPRRDDHDDIQRHREPARAAGDRAALVGLRQLRHPLQGVQHGRARPARSRRSSPTPPRSTASPASPRRSPCTSRGTASTTTTSSPGFADDLGVRLGTINSNTFQDDDYKFGSLTHVDERIRAKAIAHQLECIDIMDVTGSRDLKIWLADGTNYPGQGDLRDRQDRLADSLAAGLRPLSARPAARPRVQVLRAGLLRHRRAGLGHVTACSAWRSATAPSSASTPATTRPARTSSSSSCSCCALGRLGAFDFNSRFYADDDLIVGAADPFQLFRILYEVDPWRRLRRRTATSPSCSTSATTSRTRSPARSARCSTSRR